VKSLPPATAAKYRQVVEYRTAGLSFDEIAERCGYASRSGAKNAYDRALARWTTEDVQGMRIVQAERLDRLFTQAYVQARQGDLKAIDRCIRIEERRARLWGLDMPKQLEVTGADGAPLQTDVGQILRDRLEEIAARTPVIEADVVDD